MAQPHKGARGLISCRPPAEDADIYRRRATELGLPTGDYTVLILALAHQLPVPEHIAAKLGSWQLELLERRTLHHLSQHEFAEGA